MLSTAIPLSGTLDSSITDQGYTWYQVSMTSYRTMEITASGATSIQVYTNVGNLYGSYSGSMSSLYVTTSGTYYVKVNGTASATTTVSAMNGSSFELAYTGSASGTSYYQPSNSSSYYKVNATEGMSYTAGSSGNSLVMYDNDRTQVGTGTGKLTFTAATSGAYYVKLTGTMNTLYNLTIGQTGTSMSTAIPWTGDPLDSVITDQGYTWYQISLAAYRTTELTASGASKIEVYAGNGSVYGTSTTSSKSIFVTTSDTYYVKVYGEANAATSLSATDGSSFVRAYTGSASGTTYYQPAYKGTYYKVNLIAGGMYTASWASPNAYSVVVYDSGQAQIATGAGPLTFTATTSGTYYVKLTAAWDRTYNLTIGQTGTSMSTAIPWSGDPLDSVITDQGYTWYQVSLTGYRTTELTASGASKIEVYAGNGSVYGTSTTSSKSVFVTTSDTYYVKVYGEANAATGLSATDGSSFVRAYTGSASGTSYYQPVNKGTYYKVSLVAGGTYTANSASLNGYSLVVYDSAQAQVATGTDKLTFTAATSGTYYVKLMGTMNTMYNLTIGQTGTSMSTAIPWSGDPLDSVITDQGYAWYQVSLTGYRTTELAASDASKIEVYAGNGSVYGTSTTSSKSIFVTTSDTYYVKVYGEANAATSLSFADGSSFTLAYTGSAGGTSYYQPANTDTYYKINLAVGGNYTASSDGNSLAIYDSSQVPIAKGISKLTFKASINEVYYVKLTGVSNGVYNLTVKKPDPPTVALSLTDDAVVSDVVGVSGTVSSDILSQWVLSYGEGEQPTIWSELNRGTAIVNNKFLSNWDTRNLPSGTYTLLLTAYDVLDNVATTSVNVQVYNNLLNLKAATVTSSTYADLNWTITDSSAVAKYQLYRSQKSGSGFVTDASTKIADITDKSQRTYRATGLLPSTTYFFKLTVVYADGQPNYTSGEVSVTTAVYGNDPGTRRLTYQYDALGNILASTDPNGNVTTYEYDELNRVVAVNRPDGSKEERFYDALSRMIAQKDGTGALTQWAYNDLDQVTQVISPNGGIFRTEYDLNGNPVRRTDAEGYSSTYTFDVLGNMTEATDPLGNITRYAYDANSNVILITDPNGSSTAFSYNEVNRLTGQMDALGNVTVMGYDAAGNLTELTKPNAAKWRYTYNQNGLLESVTEPTGEMTSYSYDNVSRMQSMTNANQQTTEYEYDQWGNITQVTDPLSGTTKFVYDANGNVVSMLDRNGNSVTYEYDSMNRVTTIRPVDMDAISFAYNGEGQRTRMIDSTGTTQYAYTSEGQLQQKIAPDGKSISYSYDRNGHLMHTADYTGNLTSRSYDAAGRLVAVQDDQSGFIQYVYDAGGRRIQRLLPNGMMTEYGYDRNNRLTELINGHTASEETVTGQVYGDLEPIEHYQYTYDNVGNVTSRVDAKGNTTFAYDANDRLTNVVTPDGKQVSYTYDAVGNRLSETLHAPGETVRTRGYMYDANNRLLQLIEPDVTTLFSYDANGNLLRDGTHIYTYSTLNQLMTVTDQVYGSSVVEATYGFMYDGDGYRVGTSFQGVLTHFYWDGDQISLETDASGQQIARNVYGLERIARILGPGSAAYALLSDQQGYYLYNGHGDVTSIWDIQGSLLNTYEYDPWGVVLEKTGMLDNPFQYSGEYQDAPGRQYLRARYYDANVGRFLTEDTYRGDTANPGSLNLYTYVANNPLSYADPSGHIPEWVNETIDAVNPLSDIMTLADPCASMFDKGLAVVSIAANFFPEAKPLTIAAKEARAAKRVAKILERSVKGAGKEDPYDLLKQFGIPSTLSKEEIHAANAVDLQMMYKGPGKIDYKGVFFDKHPELKGEVVVHHSVEQQVLRRPEYKGLFTEAEMHDYSNLRGIPNEINSDIHLSKIRKEWNRFYKEYPNATKEQITHQAKVIDSKYGNLFNPPIE